MRRTEAWHDDMARDMILSSFSFCMFSSPPPLLHFAVFGVGAGHDGDTIASHEG